MKNRGRVSIIAEASSETPAAAVRLRIMNPLNCTRCQRPITGTDRTEPYTFPDDGRRVHSKCVGQLIRECLSLMAQVPDDVRLVDPEEE